MPILITAKPRERVLNYTLEKEEYDSLCEDYPEQDWDTHIDTDGNITIRIVESVAIKLGLPLS